MYQNAVQKSPIPQNVKKIKVIRNPHADPDFHQKLITSRRPTHRCDFDDLELLSKFFWSWKRSDLPTPIIKVRC